MMGWTEGIEQGVEYGRLAVQAASRVDDVALRCIAAGADGHMHFYTGRGIASSAMEEAVALERSLPGWPLDDGPTLSLGHELVWAAEVDRARSALPRATDRRARAERSHARRGSSLEHVATSSGAQGTGRKQHGTRSRRSI